MLSRLLTRPQPTEYWFSDNFVSDTAHQQRVLATRVPESVKSGSTDSISTLGDQQRRRYGQLFKPLLPQNEGTRPPLSISSAPNLCEWEDDISPDSATTDAVSSFFPFGYTAPLPPSDIERSVWTPSPDEHAARFIRPFRSLGGFLEPLAHQREEERVLGERRSASDIRNQTPRRPRTLSKPVFRAEPILYARLRPEPMSPQEESIARLEAFGRFDRENRARIVELKRDPRANVVLPDFLWQSPVDSEVFELRVPSSKRLRLGDEIDCFGGMDGIWRMVDEVGRYRTDDRPLLKKPKDWVCVRCVSDETHQEAAVTIDADFFYPSPLGTHIRQVLRKVKSLFSPRTVAAVFQLDREGRSGRDSVDDRYPGTDYYD
ncbi:hypothetical protein B0H12DRAFT_1241242 [Mycena haematopus]|nr:hypothetical protein B0H12DRAFT_1241242 [Mycena haematopus]